MLTGYVQLMARAHDLARPGSRGEAVLAAFFRAGLRGAFPLRDRDNPLCASAEALAMVAVLEELARGGRGDTQGRAL